MTTPYTIQVSNLARQNPTIFNLVIPQEGTARPGLNSREHAPEYFICYWLNGTEMWNQIPGRSKAEAKELAAKVTVEIMRYMLQNPST